MRYALYLIPPLEHPLWRWASRLIGYDAATGAQPAHPNLSGISPTALHEATRDPRRYGFHLTLKAPFRLTHGQTQATLEAALTAFCASRSAFVLGALRLQARINTSGRGFICLVPAQPCPPLFILESETVRAFEPFRAPLNAQEIARRNPEALSAAQRKLLESYGYPYVLEEFSPHFSLTGEVQSPEFWRDALDSHRPPELPCPIEGIALFLQPTPSEAFHLHGIVKFGH